MVLSALFLLDFTDRVVNPNKPERKRIVDIGSFIGKKPIRPNPRNIFDMNDPAFKEGKSKRKSFKVLDF